MRKSLISQHNLKMFILMKKVNNFYIFKLIKCSKIATKLRLKKKMIAVIFDKNNYVLASLIAQVNLHNYQANPTSAAIIQNALQSQLGLDVLRVDIRQGDEEEDKLDHPVQPLLSDRKYNNYMDDPFIRALMDAKDLYDPNRQERTEQVEQEIEEPRENQEQNQDLVSTFLGNFMSTYLEGDGLINCSGKSEETFKSKNQAPNDGNGNRYQVVVTFRQRKRDFEKFKEINDEKSKDPSIKIDETNMYLVRKKMMQCDSVFTKDFNTKLRKIRIPVKNFQIGQFVEGKGGLYEFSNYFDTAVIEKQFERYNRDRSLKFEQAMYIYQVDYRYRNTHRNLELLLCCWNAFYIKIDLLLEYVQLIQEEETSEGLILYLKLLSPPNFQVSPYNPKKSELPEVKEDWTRVHNFILEQLVAKEVIDELQRIHLINNSAIRIVMRKLEDKQPLIELNKRLHECGLEQSGVEISETGVIRMNSFKYSLLTQSSIPFSLKYNILAIISENKLNLSAPTNGLKDLNNFLFDEYLRMKNLRKPAEKIMEITARGFIQQAINLNNDQFQQRTGQQNLQLFKDLLSKYEDDVLYLDDDDEDKRIVFIRSLSLTPSGLLYNTKEPEMSNKVLRKFFQQNDLFIRLHFEDENLQTMKNMNFIFQVYFKSQMLHGIKIFERKFELLTWSSSQLRAGSCWFVDLELPRDTVVSSLGQFRGIRPVAKYAARVGQQFSSSLRFELPKVKIEIDNDESSDRKSYKYTDGIGMISENLVKLIRRKYGDQICAVQIRFGGAKGVLVINQSLQDNTIVLRKSMIKFDPPEGRYDNEIEILDTNKFRGGYMNRQIIMLLMTLGVPQEVFLQLQEGICFILKPQEYLHTLENISMIDASIYKYFNVDFNGQFQGLPSIVNILQNMINARVDPGSNIFIKGVLTRLRSRGYLILKTKANVLVDKAARLIGIIDEYDVLEQDEIYSSYSLDGKNVINITGSQKDHSVVVTRNPCLHPGDVRKLRAVTDEEVMRRKGKNLFEGIVNCIVFPKKGKLAITAQIAGGDLDGDLYFVAWDERLIFEKNTEPMVYDQKPQGHQGKPSFRPSRQIIHEDFTIEEQLDFMLQYLSSDTLGKIDNSHLAIAEKSSDLASDSRCLELSELHSRAVDYVKTGEAVVVKKNLLAKEWPDYMEKANKNVEFEGKTALGKMYRRIKEIIAQSQSKLPSYGGIKEPNLPLLDPFVIINYQRHFRVIEREGVVMERKKDSNPEDIPQTNVSLHQSFINQNFSNHIEVVVKTMDFAFRRIRALMTLYDIKDEFEIYSGNISSLVKGDGVHQKKRFNFENIQKKLIQHLVLLRNDLYKYLYHNIDAELKLQRLSLLHLILQYSPESHPFDGSVILQFLHVLFKLVYRELEAKNILRNYTDWYRAFTWFFFSDDLLKIIRRERQSGEEQEEQEQALIQSEAQDNQDSTQQSELQII